MDGKVYKGGLAVILIAAVVIMTLFGIKLSSKKSEIVQINSETSDECKEVSENSSKNTPNKIRVDIDGEIKKPGVYEFNDGDRVNDAINFAGGLTDKADTKNLNRARKLTDGEKIYIYGIDEERDEESEISNHDKININTASEELLKSLNGIGDVYAKKIIEYRNEHSFTSIEQLKNISGIGEKTYNKIKDKITCD